MCAKSPGGRPPPVCVPSSLRCPVEPEPRACPTPSTPPTPGNPARIHPSGPCVILPAHPTGAFHPFVSPGIGARRLVWVCCGRLSHRHALALCVGCVRGSLPPPQTSFLFEHRKASCLSFAAAASTLQWGSAVGAYGASRPGHVHGRPLPSGRGPQPRLLCRVRPCPPFYF